MHHQLYEIWLEQRDQVHHAEGTPRTATRSRSLLYGNGKRIFGKGQPVA